MFAWGGYKEHLPRVLLDGRRRSIQQDSDPKEDQPSCAERGRDPRGARQDTARHLRWIMGSTHAKNEQASRAIIDGNVFQKIPNARM